MSFKEELFDYEDMRDHINQKLDSFTNWLCAIPNEEGLRLSNLKWYKDYGSTYTSHEFNGKQVTVHFSSYDCCCDEDVFDTCSVSFSVKWVDMYWDQGEEVRENLRKQVVQEYLKYNKEQKQRDFELLKRKVEDEGYIIVKIEPLQEGENE